MKINLKREGGFVGMPANKIVDLKDLPEDDQQAITEAVDNAPPPPKTKTKDRSLEMRDVCSYEIKMKKGNKTVTVKYDDTTIPEKVYLMFQKYL